MVIVGQVPVLGLGAVAVDRALGRHLLAHIVISFFFFFSISFSCCFFLVVGYWLMGERGV